MSESPAIDCPHTWRTVPKAQTRDVNRHQCLTCRRWGYSYRETAPMGRRVVSRSPLYGLVIPYPPSFVPPPGCSA